MAQVESYIRIRTQVLEMLRQCAEEWPGHPVGLGVTDQKGRSGRGGDMTKVIPGGSNLQ